MRRGGFAGGLLLSLIAAACASLDGLSEPKAESADAGPTTETEAPAPAEETGAPDAGSGGPGNDADAGVCEPAAIVCPAYDGGFPLCDPFEKESDRLFSVLSSGKGSFAIAGGESRVAVTGPGDRALFIAAIADPTPRRFTLAMRVQRKATQSTIAIASASQDGADIATLRVSSGMLQQCPGKSACIDVGPWTDAAWHTVKWALDTERMSAQLDCGPLVETLLPLMSNTRIEPRFGIASTTGPATVNIDVARVD